MSVNEQQNIMKNTVLNSEKQSTSMPLQNNKKKTDIYYTAQWSGIFSEGIFFIMFSQDIYVIFLHNTSKFKKYSIKMYIRASWGPL